uniref:Pep3/Vps18 beta-propeller domain-containing protein n=1 Tax=Photinus pyralis TaxID=7054 RepID=A0A1Y1NPC1_PHOPY
MAGMFDQFEQPAQRSEHNNTWNQSGFIHMKLEQDVPIFEKARMNFTPSEKVTHVAISNKYLVVAMANSILFRMDIQQPDQQNEISLAKYTKSCRLSNMFLDPTGVHLLLSFSPRTQETVSELLYLPKSSHKLRATTKFRGLEVTEVGWNYTNKFEASTGPILIGTSKGLIFETEILLEGDKFFTTGLELYCKQVFDIGKGTNTPINGIEFRQIFNSDRYFIFVATPIRLYHFVGTIASDEKPMLQQIFNKYLNIPESLTYYEVKSKLRYSRLKFWSENNSNPSALAWLIEDCILYTKFDPLSDKDISEVMKQSKEIFYPKPVYQDYSVLQKPPIACVLTEFHVLIAYVDKIKGVSLLNKELVYEDNYNEAFGRLVNIIKDPIAGTIWAVAENTVFRFKIAKEDRNVWQIYCDGKNFDLAKRYSRNNPVHYNHVLIKEADMLFEEKKYMESANGYALALSGFEEICLKFIQVNQQDALKTFLCKKLETFNPHDKTQITLIVIWVIELYLNQLEKLRISGKEQTPQFFDLQKDFQAFLALEKVAERIKSIKSTIYNLMASHGDKTNSIQLTIVQKDFEKLIREQIYKNSFHEALDVLKSQNNKELFYQFSPILMQEIPKFTVKALIEQGSKLVPRRLLPAFANCEDELHCNEVITYLEFCVEKLLNTEHAIHNLLISLYAKNNSEKLMKYLDSQGQDLTMVHYNVHFALRLCQEHKLTQACVQLSAMLGLWESAVDLALTIDINLAKQYANTVQQHDTELRKKLWLKIGKEHFTVLF